MNQFNWFIITGINVEVFNFKFVQITYNYFEVTLNKSNNIYKISDIFFPEEILFAYYASLCESLEPKILNTERIITFVDEMMENPPIILPKWTVLKYCNLKFIDMSFVKVNIVTDQEVANAIMNMFEKEEKPKSFTKTQFVMFQKMIKFLTE